VRGSDVFPFMNTSASNEDDPAHWRLRANQTRRAAMQMLDPIAKKTLMEIADAYVQLATLAEAKLASKK
jgi:hypothetical protein